MPNAVGATFLLKPLKISSETKGNKPQTSDKIQKGKDSNADPVKSLKEKSMRASTQGGQTADQLRFTDKCKLVLFLQETGEEVMTTDKKGTQ